ncbi:unnamed protein product [Leptidea sinapis]|uniref:Cadherin domain-containing protein n=1 Tax=Leptidea sinapis TaxID=189913 RepID=A0A5E4QJN9_9NEOP|nr:unnamed protein product [Leptidea sinapis]
MLLVFVIISQIFVSSLASPYHRYPFTFLLDVGNEELGKANSEQIKVSVPGGNLALKYPANGNGDIIGHIRVTGIDFGTELKVSIAEGGPGYRYVVLVLMGKPNMQYDTVITIQTLQDDDNEIQASDNNINAGESYQVDEDIDDSNDSAEDTNEYNIETKAMQAMEMNSEIARLNKYVREQYDESNSRESMSFSNKNNENDEEFDGQKDFDRSEEDDSLVSHSNKNSDEVILLRTTKYGKYDAFIPRILGGLRIYPQAAVPQDQGYQAINDIEHVDDDDDGPKVQSVNDFNNNIESENVSPVEY